MPCHSVRLTKRVEPFSASLGQKMINFLVICVHHQGQKSTEILMTETWKSENGLARPGHVLVCEVIRNYSTRYFSQISISLWIIHLCLSVLSLLTGLASGVFAPRTVAAWGWPARAQIHVPPWDSSQQGGISWISSLTGRYSFFDDGHAQNQIEIFTSATSCRFLFGESIKRDPPLTKQDSKDCWMVRYPCGHVIFWFIFSSRKCLVLRKLTIMAMNIGTDGLWLRYLRMRPPITSRRLQALCSWANVWSSMAAAQQK